MFKNNKALLTIFLVVFIDLLGFGIILPILPYIAEKYQANPLQIGLLTATYSFFQLISSPILGRLSDKFGRKKLLIISQLGTFIGFIILALANNLSLLFLSRIIDGITGGNISIAQAYIADVTDQKNRAKGMGLIGAAFGLGFIFGPVIGGLLSKTNYSAPAFFAAFISLITIVITNLFLKETVKIKIEKVDLFNKFEFKEFKKIIKKSIIDNLIISFFIINLSFTMIQGVLALWTERTFGFTPENNGWIFTYVGILAVFFQLVVLPKLIKKFSEKKLLKMAILFLSLGMIFIFNFKFIFGFLFALIFISFGNGLANPTIQALASEKVSKNDYGETLGLLQSAGSLGRIFGPVIGGEVFMILGKDMVFLISSFICFILLVYLHFKLR